MTMLTLGAAARLAGVSKSTLAPRHQGGPHERRQPPRRL
jgi:hypothetical protein